MHLRTYERGVEGETLACGSGAVAAAGSMVRRGLVEPPVECTTASGTLLRVDFGEGSPGVDATARLEGDARIVARGSLGPDVLPGKGRP
jgi:diaminopimelate epimerase